MSRAPFQVLVLPYKIGPKNTHRYAIFSRRDSKNCWQGIAGGGESNESPRAAAKREAYEEAGIETTSKYIKLDALCTLPVVNVCGFKWGPKVLVIPEYCFGVEIKEQEIKLSREHSGFKWVSYVDAMKMLKWDSNRNALWELNYRLGKSLSAYSEPIRPAF